MARNFAFRRVPLTAGRTELIQPLAAGAEVEGCACLRNLPSLPDLASTAAPEERGRRGRGGLRMECRSRFRDTLEHCLAHARAYTRRHVHNDEVMG